MARNRHYDTEAHRQWRIQVILNAGRLCQECRRYGRLDKNGLPVAATTAHHVIPIEEAPELALDVSNGRALCARCHNKKHPEKGGKYW